MASSSSGATREPFLQMDSAEAKEKMTVEMLPLAAILQIKTPSNKSKHTTQQSNRTNSKIEKTQYFAANPKNPCD